VEAHWTPGLDRERSVFKCSRWLPCKATGDRWAQLRDCGADATSTAGLHPSSGRVWAGTRCRGPGNPQRVKQTTAATQEWAVSHCDAESVDVWRRILYLRRHVSGLALVGPEAAIPPAVTFFFAYLDCLLHLDHAVNPPTTQPLSPIAHHGYRQEAFQKVQRRQEVVQGGENDLDTRCAIGRRTSRLGSDISREGRAQGCCKQAGRV
jgi:hypothetical protein